MTATLTRPSKGGIPLWVNLMQAALILIMAAQVFELFLDHDALNESGHETEGDPALNFVYTMGSRLTVMILISAFVMITQNALQYVVVLIMNVAREGFETIIDPLWPVANATAPPIVDFVVHVVIVSIELAALVTVLRIARSQQWQPTALVGN